MTATLTPHRWEAIQTGQVGAGRRIWLGMCGSGWPARISQFIQMDAKQLDFIEGDKR